MARYFFNVDGESTHDDEGVELESLAAAKCQAVKTSAALICDSAKRFWDRRDFSMTVSNANGLTLFSLMFIGMDAAAIGRPCPGSEGLFSA